MEDILLEATENDENLKYLNKKLCSILSLDVTTLDLLKESFELILESKNYNEDTFLQTCLRMAELGVDSKNLRDKINSYIPLVFSEVKDIVEPYLDLALYSLVDVAISFNKLLTIFDSQISSDYNPRNTGKKFIYHNQFNFGELTSVKGEQITINFFSGNKQLGLEFIIKQCLCFKTGSFVNQFLEGKKLVPNDFYVQDICQNTYTDIIPITELKKTILIHMMMPKYFKKAMLFDRWFARKKTKNTEKLDRLWFNSRSLAELLQNILLEKKLEWNKEIEDKILNIFLKEGNKEKQALTFVKSIIGLYDKLGSKNELEGFLKNLTNKDIVVWNNKEKFIEVCNELNISQLDSFMTISVLVVNDWLNKTIVDFPLRIWESLNRALRTMDRDTELLSIVQKAIKSQDTSSDIILFLWKSYNKDTSKIKDYIGSPDIILRALNQKGLRGNFLKVQKDLKKLLLSDKGTDFLNFILGNGEEEKVKVLVNSLKGYQCLDEQEKQSLLVRVTRLYDSAKQIIECNIESEVSEASFPRVTALINYKNKQEELKKVIEEIPQNTKAISTAREHGDLRENAEYQAAKERQRYLLARREELNELLEEVRPTNFADVELKERIIPGCSVELSVEKDNVLIYTILGELDSNPLKNFISFDTPLGMLLLGKKIGDEVILPNNSKQCIVKDIKPLNKKVLDWINS